MDATAPFADEDTDAGDRRRATLAILPFLLLGLADVALIVGMGLRPLWGFLLLPPILFTCAIGWLGFKSGFIR